ncbi:type 1 periplasmic-binding domain-containing protein [Amycolatopsis samaneae]|uniref:ABC-type branched-chain amino acid transport system, substrate-binding protein n=1 Tax=Amycolatopsis samaneae TaxID=664691 RepID=A0ABW5GNI9_9PSEU
MALTPTVRERDPLVFGGADRLVKLIGALYQRPRAGDRPRELDEVAVRWKPGYHDERSGRRGLPMVCLVRPDSAADVLPELSRWLAEAKPEPVRHAYLGLAGREGADADGPATQRSVKAVRELLWEARNALIRDPRARGSRLRFGLFTLVVWLMSQKIAEHDPNPDRTLLRRVQRLGIVERFRTTIQHVDDKLPGDKFWWRVPLAVLRGLTALSFRAAATGRVPLLSGPYRWFLRQPHLAPEMSGSFVRFARRLTDGEWQREAPEYVSRLLVNAFLEDLRRAYRIRPWQPWRRRRMTYPVLMLDAISPANGGYRLLRLINGVRNQVGLFDPLLVVSASDDVPPDAGRGDPERPRFDATTAAEGYRAWQNALRDDRRARRDTAWYLPIRIREGEPKEALDDARRRLASFDGYHLERRLARPPWWASRWTRIGVPVLVVVLAAAGLIVQRQTTLDSHCGTDSPSLVWTGTECVGMSDGAFDLFQPSDDTTAQVSRIIHEQNLRAEQLHRAHPERPYITIVDLEAVTSSTGTVEGVTAERESLEGFAVAQLRQLSAPAASDPIVRILHANAGRGMREGVRVAGMLRELAEQDRSIVAVAGLDLSSDPTQRAITALSNAGIPMVASTLSADGLADNNPMYFQVTPQNRREAEVAAAFAQRLPEAAPRQARVYYSDDDADIYSTNLRDDLMKSFAARGFAVEARALTPNGGIGGQPAHERYGERLVGNPAAAGRDTCSFPGVVFFAARGVPDFGEFAGGAGQCGTKAAVIGDDDVTRYVADKVSRQLNRALSFYTMSFATEPITAPQGLARDFYGTLNQLFPFEQTERGRSLDGHAAMAFDAAQVLITATAYLRETAASIPVTPGAVWREITAVHTSRPDARQTNKYIEGVTGTIDYGGDISRNVPENKPVAVLRVEGGEVSRTIQAFCGNAAGRTADPWCPVEK